VIAGVTAGWPFLVGCSRAGWTPLTSAPTPAEAFRRLYLGFRVTQAVYAAAELGIADLLAGGPRSADELAAAAGAHAPSLYRVLRLLASEGVFAETDDGRFALTPMAEPGTSRRSGSARAHVLFTAGPALWRSWGELLHSVRTGEPAFDRAHGVDLFRYLRDHAEEGLVFDQAMAALTAPATRAVAAAYDFSRVGTVVDVGGGNGALAIGLLEAHPHLRAVVFDQPAAAAGARAAIAAAGLADRCAVVGGDFFAAVPDGGDAYVVKYVLHDWDDERCAAILRACRRAMAPGARLLVVELLVPPGNGASFAKSMDAAMLVVGGRERTEAEYRGLLAAAGFELTGTIPAQGELHVIEATPV
jgi:precorrin-6B methylase 2